jgi:hypothetical protein
MWRIVNLQENGAEIFPAIQKNGGSKPMPVLEKTTSLTRISFIAVSLAFGIIAVQPLPASANYAEKDSSPEESKNKGQAGTFDTKTLLRMNKQALRNLLRDYMSLKTTDGFGYGAARWLIHALITSKSETRRILNRLENIRGEKYRTKILTDEKEKTGKRVGEIQDILNGEKFVKISSSRKRQLWVGVRPNSALEREYVSLGKEFWEINNLNWFVSWWLKNPNAGPGGSIQVKP